MQTMEQGKLQAGSEAPAQAEQCTRMARAHIIKEVRQSQAECRRYVVTNSKDIGATVPKWCAIAETGRARCGVPHAAVSLCHGPVISASSTAATRENVWCFATASLAAPAAAESGPANDVPACI